MTTIKTTCARCGDVELLPEDLSLELSPASATGAYRFHCPFCVSMQRRPANARVVSILLATGVTYEVVVDPTDPITEAEVALFTEALERDDWFEDLASN